MLDHRVCGLPVSPSAVVFDQGIGGSVDSKFIFVYMATSTFTFSLP